MFIIYITLRGQLTNYMGLFTGKVTNENTTSKTNTSFNKAFGDYENIASNIPSVLKDKVNEVFSNMGLG